MKKMDKIDCRTAFAMTESGRSMVEMMGVLAIMGIIAIGGLAGFRSAMNKMSASKIVEIIGEVSGEAQRHNDCIDAAEDDDDDFEMPQCVDEIVGAENGQVLIAFENKDGCAELENAVGSSFGKCRWEKDGEHTYIYIPNRGSACKEEETNGTGCKTWYSGHNADNPCENFTKSRCLTVRNCHSERK